MEFSCIKGSKVVVDLEITSALFDGCVPSDSFEDGFGTVITEATFHHLKGRIAKQHPYFRVCRIKILKVMGHSRLLVR